MTHVLRKKIGVETAGTGIPQLPAVSGIGRYISLHGLTQPIYTEENTMEIYADSEKALMSSQERRLYPIPLLICTDGTEYTFGFSCYKKLPSDFNSTPHSIRIRVYTGYNWRPWDATPEIAELEADGTLCFSLRDSNRERKTSRVILFRSAQHLPASLHLAHTTFPVTDCAEENVKRKETSERKSTKRDRSKP